MANVATFGEIMLRLSPPGKELLFQSPRLEAVFGGGGANERPARVVYDREGSGIAEAKPGDIDWEAAFAGMDRLHVTGITPALSASAAALTLEAVEAARGGRMAVSPHLN